MACYHPIRAWRTRSGEVRLNKEMIDSFPLALPCGNCLGCRTTRAKEWALRCHLELQQHPTAAFVTLTYNDESLPPTLDKTHLQKWVKRLRKKMGPRRPIRHFCSGEYGETNYRPHYHGIIYGLNPREQRAVEETWGLGYTQTLPISPQRISYVAGYTSKKIGWKLEPRERVDPETGEVFTWQPPFVQMSRRPGIGAHAKQHTNSWRHFAILNGTRLPVPKFLHSAWEEQATAEDKEQLEYERYNIRKTQQITLQILAAKEHNAVALQALKASRRNL